MKKLNNKKGFTLIEMLVVIAIIAVLVAIIIPVVSSATTKAAAATDAANMRSYKAQIVTSYLSDGVGTGKSITGINATGVATVDSDKIATPAMKAFKVGSVDITTDAAWVVNFDDTTKEFTVTYADKTIADFAAVAETGKFPAATPTT